MLLKNEFSFQKKSKIKAGDGKKEGLYPFFTSSDTKVLFIDEYLFNGEAVILGTGGMPSCNYYNGKFAVSTDNFVLTSKGNILPKVLYYFLRNNNLSILAEGFHGAGLKHIGKEYIENIDIPFISKQNQIKLVAELDGISESIKNVDYQTQKLDELVKSRFIEMFGDLSTNPKRYPIKKLSEISNYWNGLTFKPTDVVDSGQGTLVLRSSNIQEGKLCFEDNVFVNCQIKDKHLVKQNDILMCSRNGSARLVGKVALIDGLTEPTSFGAFMMIIRSEYYPFLKIYFESDWFKGQLSTGTSTVNQITGGMLNQVILPVPTKEEVTTFEKFTKQIDKSKFILQKQKKNLEELYESKLHEYFGD